VIPSRAWWRTTLTSRADRYGSTSFAQATHARLSAFSMFGICGGLGALRDVADNQNRPHVPSLV
jgi:hypothetical protein